MEECCVVCAEPLEWVGYGACGHRDVCSTCVARLRFILNDKNCCICKQECPSVFVTKALGDYTKIVKDFEGLCDREDLWYEANLQAYFDDKEHFTLLKAMCRLSCPKCEQASGSCFEKGRAFDSLDLLRRHITHSHKLQMCNLCLEGRKVFICEQKLYSKAQLECHLAKGDSEVDGVGHERGGFSGHPMCKFCQTRFYGENELYQHMSVDHFLCHICQRMHPGQYDYFCNYDDLEAHFRHKHALCEHPDCLEKKFVVFMSDVELKRHNVSTHGGSMSRSQRYAALQVPISFQFSRRAQGRGPPHHNVPLSNGQSNSQTQGGIVPTTSNELHAREPLSPSGTRSGLNGPEYSDRDGGVSIVTHSLGYLTAAGGVGPPNLEDLAFPPLPGGSKLARRKAKQRARASSTAAADGALSENKTCGSSHMLRVPDNPSSSGTGRVSMQNPWLHGPSASSASRVKVIRTAIGVPGRRLALPRDDIVSREERVNATHPATAVNGWAPIPSSDEMPGGNVKFSLECDPQNGFELTEEVRLANKALAEDIRLKLGGDYDLFVAFKDISVQFRAGNVDSGLYCEHIRGFGLWELVPELARLCPDPEKQKSLLCAYESDRKKLGRAAEGDFVPSSGRTNSRIPRVMDKEGATRANVTEGLLMRKGKQKVEASASSVPLASAGSSTQNGVYKQPKSLLNCKNAFESAQSRAMETWSCIACTLENDASESRCAVCKTSRYDDGDDRTFSTFTAQAENQGKRKKKISKFERLRLDDVSQQPPLQVKEPPAPSSVVQKGCSLNRGSGGGGHGAWRNSGGQRLVALAQRDAVIESAWKR